MSRAHDLACLLEGAAMSARALRAPNAVIPPATLEAAARELRELARQVEEADAFERSLSEALNSGAGVYRP